MNHIEPPPSPSGLAHADRSSDMPRSTPTVNSQSLLRGQKVVAIEHNGELYRLQSTRTGKLILTK